MPTTVRAADQHVADVVSDLLVVPVFKGGIEGPGTEPVLTSLGLDAVPVTPAFRGDAGQHLLLGAPGAGVGAVLFVGLGRMDAVDDERLRRAAGLAGAHASRRPAVSRVATTLAQLHPTASAVTAITEGFLLGGLGERPPGQDQDAGVGELTVLVPSSLLPAAAAAVDRGSVYARAGAAARRLVDLPGDRKRPPELADRISELAGRSCAVTVHDETWLAEQGFGGLRAVGAGSSAPPRLVELAYRPAHPLGTVVLVGKGITFDTGGLSLKRGNDMEGMKADMAGAAAIAAACGALADVGARMEVIALLGLAENMPGSDAQRPGDVIVAHGGATIEVLDTDAEGRLVLADLLDAAGVHAPDAVVDCATLTGAAISALGRYAGAVMGTDDTLVEALQHAGTAVGEALWRLPLVDDYDRFLDSAVADCNNTGDGPGAGAITAGLFLRRFAGDLPWAHLDIAGPAFLSKELARDYWPAGGTGFGARTLLAWLDGREL